MRLFSTSLNIEPPSSREDVEKVAPVLSSSLVGSGMAWVGGNEKVEKDVFGFNQGKPSLSPSLYTVTCQRKESSGDRYLLGTGITQVLREREKRTLMTSGSIPENVAYTIH